MSLSWTRYNSTLNRGEYDPKQAVSICEPLKFREECLKLNVPLDPWWGKCNSITWPLGPEPSIIHLLVTYGEVIKRIERERTTPEYQGHLMAMRLTDVNGVDRNIDSLFVHSFRCVSGGNPRDDNAVYMITLRDYRARFWQTGYSSAVADNENFHVYCGAPAYNIPRHQLQSGDNFFVAPSTFGAQIYTPSMNQTDTDSALWGWQAMLDQLGIDTFFAATSPFTDIPYTPVLPPYNFDFQSTGEFVCIAAALDRLSVGIVMNPFDASNSFQRMQMCVIGQDTIGISTVLDTLSDYLLFDFNSMSFDHASSNLYHVNFRCKVFDYDPDAYTSNHHLIDADVLITLYTHNDAAAQSYGGYTRKSVDHDVPVFLNCPFDTTQPYSSADFQASLEEHEFYYTQSVMATKQINRIYSGFHTEERYLPGSMIKIIRWEDVGQGMRTHIYAGDGYLPPHAIYHLVNPHRYHRRDEIERFKTIDQIDLTKI